MAEIGRLFRSTEELESPVEADVSGSIPEWLRGTFLRVGPGKFDLSEDFTVNHYSDGMAVLSKFDIKDGKVQFHKRFLRSDAYLKAVSVGRTVYAEYATRAYADPTKSVFSRVVSSLSPDMTDNCFQNINAIGGSLYAATESCFIREINPKTLETGKKVDFVKELGIHFVMSHMHEDDKGNKYSIGVSIVTGLKYNIIKMPAIESTNSDEVFKKMEIISKLKSRWKTCYSYIHSFGMTDRWIVFIEQPLLVKGLKLLTAHLNRKTMRDCSEWCPEEKNVFYIIDKSTGKVLPIEYESEKSFFVFHHINAYEEDNHLVVDVIGQDKPEILDNMFLDMLRNSDCKHGNKGSVWRFVLPLAENIKDLPENQNLVGLKYSSATATRKDDTVIVNYEIFTEPAYELPTVNRAFNGKPYKYFYAGGLHDESVYKNCIIKVNLETKEVTTWKDSEYCFSGPTEFISRPGAVQEDDGVLLTAVTDIRHDRRGYLVILDAATMTEIARAQVTEHVPCAVHGLFLPNLE